MQVLSLWGIRSLWPARRSWRRRLGTWMSLLPRRPKGIALAYEISRLLGKRNLLLQGKASNPICAAWYRYRCIPSRPPGEQHLYLDGHDAKRLCGKRVCIVDDVISTGESLYALEALVESARVSLQEKQQCLQREKQQRETTLSFTEAPLFHKCDDNSYEIKES